MFNEEIYRLCKNYSHSSGKCMINCYRENVSSDDNCPFQKENETDCSCFKSKKKIEDRIDNFLKK